MSTGNGYLLSTLPARRKQPDHGRYDAIILAVAHDQFKELGVPALRRFGHDGVLVYDVKHLFPAEQVNGRL